MKKLPSDLMRHCWHPLEEQLVEKDVLIDALKEESRCPVTSASANFPGFVPRSLTTFHTNWSLSVQDVFIAVHVLLVSTYLHWPFYLNIFIIYLFIFLCQDMFILFFIFTYFHFSQILYIYIHEWVRFDTCDSMFVHLTTIESLIFVVSGLLSFQF